MRISDWSSDVCSSDLRAGEVTEGRTIGAAADIEDVAREPGRHVADLPFHDRGAAPAADLPADRAECCEEPAEQFASGYHDGRPRRGRSSGGWVVPRPPWLASLASGSPSGPKTGRA